MPNSNTRCKTFKPHFQVIQGGRDAQPLTDYQKFEKGIIESLAPVGIEETLLAISIAQGHWRINQVREAEFRLFAPADSAPDPAAAQARIFFKNSAWLAKIALLEERMQNVLERMIKRLQKIQKIRQREELAARTEACAILRQALLDGSEPAPHRSVEQNGFVFSVADLLKDIALQQLREKVRRPKAS